MQSHAALAEGENPDDWLPASRTRANALEEGLAVNV